MVDINGQNFQKFYPDRAASYDGAESYVAPPPRRAAVTAFECAPPVVDQPGDGHHVKVPISLSSVRKSEIVRLDRRPRSYVRAKPSTRTQRLDRIEP